MAVSADISVDVSVDADVSINVDATVDVSADVSVDFNIDADVSVDADVKMFSRFPRFSVNVQHSASAVERSISASAFTPQYLQELCF